MKNLAQVIALSGLAIVAACGGSSVTGTSGGGGGGGTGGGVSTNVVIQDFSYNPESITVKAGTTVKWTNNGPSAHTSVSDAGAWDSGVLSPPGMGAGGYTGTGTTVGGSFQLAFSTPGTFRYHCSIHPPSLYPNFRGVVVVTP